MELTVLAPLFYFFVFLIFVHFLYLCITKEFIVLLLSFVNNILNGVHGLKLAAFLICQCCLLGQFTSLLCHDSILVSCSPRSRILPVWVNTDADCPSAFLLEKGASCITHTLAHGHWVHMCVRALFLNFFKVFWLVYMLFQSIFRCYF